MISINEILKPDFDWEKLKIDDEQFDELCADLIIDFLKKNTPKERQLLALSWNFDNSKKVIKWIIDQKDTDKGTILYLYWYMAPIFYKDNYANRKECEIENSWTLEDYDIIATIEKIIFLIIIKNRFMDLIQRRIYILKDMIGLKGMMRIK